MRNTAPMPADDDLAHVRICLGRHLDAMLVYNILRTHSYLSPSIDAALRRHNLTAAQFNTLLVLRAAGGHGALMGRIGERLVVTKSNVTGLVDRLEAQGLVKRGEDRDRRATLVRLTRAGRALVNRAMPRHAALLAAMTRCLGRAEKAALIRLLTKLRRQLRQSRRGSA